MITLLDLNPELLDAIFAHLRAWEAARVLPFVCRKLNQLLRSPLPQLWRAVLLSLEKHGQEQPWKEKRAKLESLVQWLGPRAPALRVLVLRLELPEGPAIRDACWRLVTAALGAVAPTLQELQFAWPGPLEVGGWLEPLTALSALSLEARELRFTPDAQRLASLQRLSVALPARRRPALTFAAPGCLPLRLEAVDLFGAGLSSLPTDQLAPLAHLRTLDLSCNPRLTPDSFGALSALRALQELSLSLASLQEVPHHLSHLTSLRVLFLHRCLSEPPPLEALQQQFEAALAPLRRLIMLSISENGLKSLPLVITSLTGLRALHVEGNEAQLMPGPYLSGLRELCLDWNTLFGSHALLAAAATQLSKLYVSGSHTVGEDGAAGGGPAEVAASLAACPRLAHFVDVLAEGSGESLDLEVAQLMYRLPAVCPRLKIAATANEDFGYSLATLPASWQE